MAGRGRRDPSDGTVGPLLLRAAGGGLQGVLSGSAREKRPFSSPEHHAERLEYFLGEPDGIWQARAEPKLINSCWPHTDLCVAMAVYQHLALQG